MEKILFSVFVIQYSVFKYLSSNSTISIWYCQALSISQSLNLSLSLRDRDRAHTIITLYNHHRKLFNPNGAIFLDACFSLKFKCWRAKIS